MFREGSSWPAPLWAPSWLRPAPSFSYAPAYRFPHVGCSMKCSKPYVLNSQALPCGQCLACRINRRRLWTHRLMLEGLEWSSKSFLTLTYSTDKLPLVPRSTTPTLLRTDLQKWLKRFRKRIEPTKVRYFAAGEYGEKSGRPHYHLVMFGWPACHHGRTRKHVRVCCEPCEVVRQTWGQGHIMNAEFNRDTVQYTCGYVIKKMTSPDDYRLNGREPEFATMSLRPGIGAGAMDEMASTVLQHDLEVNGDVPTVLAHGVKGMGIGRYLTKRLRERTGRDAAVPQAKVEKMAEEMRPLRKFAFDNSLPLSQVITEALRPKTDQAERRHRFYRKKGIL